MNERSRAPMALALLAALLLLALLVPSGSIVLLGYFAVLLIPFVALVGGLGLCLASRTNRPVAVAGQIMASFAGGLVLYVFVAVPIYTLFYGLNPFDRYTGEGATAFKVWFWLAYCSHVLLTPIVAAVIARLLKRPLFPAAIGAGAAAALLAYPTLVSLAYFNNCYGMEFPLGRMSCG